MRAKSLSRLTRLSPSAVALASAALAVTVSLSSPVQAQSHQQNRPQNVFEALFPGLIQQRLDRQRALAPPAVVEKVKGPQYFTYQPQKLVRVDLSGLAGPIADDEPARAEPAAVQSELLEPAEPTPADETASVKLRPGEKRFEMIAPRFEALAVMAEPQIAKLIVSHYDESRSTLWLTDDMRPNARAKTVLAVFAQAGDYGLDPTDYDVGLAEPGADAASTQEAAARFEIAMTARAVRYGIDASVGRVDPNKLSGYHDFKRDKDAAKSVLDAISGGGLPAPSLVALHPSNSAYRALADELKRLRETDNDQIVIAEGTLIKPGQTHDEVANVIAAIAQRGSEQTAKDAAALLEAPEPTTSFSEEVVAVVKAFQKENRLTADGIVGPATISRLTGVSTATKRERVKLAMERLRWHPHELGSRHVFINQPAYRARYVNVGKTQLDMRAIVGKKSNQTYFFHDVIETVEYNPYWGVPRSIIVNTYLQKLRENPAYFDERGYEVTDKRGQRIASAAVNWNQVGADVPFDVRQQPGRTNALGELKIMFPNAHAIYMHDTPARNLFSRDRRAFSHGCVRLQNPREMAAAVLGKNVSYIGEQIAQGKNLVEQVGGNIPVYVAYFTAWPDDNGKVGYHGDIYGRDAHLAKALGTVRSSRGAAI